MPNDKTDKERNIQELEDQLNALEIQICRLSRKYLTAGAFEQTQIQGAQDECEKRKRSIEREIDKLREELTKPDARPTPEHGGPSKVLHNLGDWPPRYSSYVDRIDNQEEKLDELVYDMLRKKRHWVYAIHGAPGIGKSALAYRIAELCLERKLFNAIIWFPFQKYELGSGGGIIPFKNRISSFAEFLNTIAATTGNRGPFKEYNTDSKLSIIQEEILSKSHVLLILDNFRDSDDDLSQKILEFLNYLRPPSKSLITAQETVKSVFDNSMERIHISHMRKEEAEELIEKLAHSRGLLLSARDVEQLIEYSGCVPMIIRHTIGQIETGRKVEEIIERKLGLSFYDECYEDRQGDEQRIWHVLNVFREPAPYEAVEYASEVQPLADSIPTLRILNVVQQFSDNLLVLADQPRDYLQTRMSGSLMEIDGVAATDFLHQVMVRLSTYYATQLEGMDIDDRLDFLRHQKYNVFMCMDWCDENGEWNTLFSLIDAMGQPLGILGRLEARLEWGKRASEISREVFDNEIKAAWHDTFDVGWCLARQGKLDEGQGKLNEARRVFHERLKDDFDISYLPVNAVVLCYGILEP